MVILMHRTFALFAARKLKKEDCGIVRQNRTCILQIRDANRIGLNGLCKKPYQKTTKGVLADTIMVMTCRY